MNIFLCVPSHPFTHFVVVEPAPISELCKSVPNLPNVPVKAWVSFGKKSVAKSKPASWLFV